MKPEMMWFPERLGLNLASASNLICNLKMSLMLTALPICKAWTSVLFYHYSSSKLLIIQLSLHPYLYLYQIHWSITVCRLTEKYLGILINALDQKPLLS